MAFLDSPILKTRRMGTISPETLRKFQLAKAPASNDGECSDFMKLHQNITCTQKCFTLLDVNANANAIKLINETTKKQAEKLENLRDSFKKVQVNEKNGFSFDDKVISEVREKLMYDTVGSLDPHGGISSISLSRCSSDRSVTLREFTEDSSTLKPHQCDEILSDTDTESLLSDFEMEIVNVSSESNAMHDHHPILEPLDLESPVSDTHLSQKSIILSSSGMYSIYNDDEEYAIVSMIPSSHHDDKAKHPNNCDEENLEEFSKPRCDTCASWDAFSLEMEDSEDETVNHEDLNMVIETNGMDPVKIEVFRSPVLPRKVGSNTDQGGSVPRVIPKLLAVSDKTVSKKCSLHKLKKDDDTKINEHDNMDSISIEHVDFALDDEDSEEFRKFEADVKELEAKMRLMDRIKNDRVKQLVARASNIVHSASADFAKFGLKRSDSSASIRKPRSSSTSTFFKHNISLIPRPNYDLSSTLMPKSECTDILNLDSRLKLQNRALIDVEPLQRWKIKPSFALTTSGHKAWYQRAQDLIESRRKEMINMDSLNQDEQKPRDLDILVRAIVSRCTCKTPFQLDRVGDGKYKLPNTSQIFFVRILRNHVMVRVGGGWDTLDHFIAKHDPCRMKFKQISGGEHFSPSSQSPTSAKSKGSAAASPVQKRSVPRSPMGNRVPIQKSASGHSLRSPSPRNAARQSPVGTPKSKAKQRPTEGNTKLPRPAGKSKLPQPKSRLG